MFLYMFLVVKVQYIADSGSLVILQLKLRTPHCQEATAGARLGGAFVD